MNVDSIFYINQAIVAFDTAIKRQFSNWLGWHNYDWTDTDNPKTKAGVEILKQIDSLDLSNYGIKVLPQAVLSCPNLRHLNLLGNPDMHWHDCFTKLTETKVNSVYVSIPGLWDIAPEFWHFITGIEITGTGTGLKEIPMTILQQKQLNYLDLSAFARYPNSFDNIDQLFIQLPNLKYLFLNYCGIRKLPSQISNLTKLQKLDLRWNGLETLPPEINKLKNLTHLYLCCNAIKEIPPEIGDLKNLEVLDLGDNRLTYLPDEIGNLVHLHKLDLTGNFFKSFPLPITKLESLSYLSLSDNELNTLPKEIKKLKNLQILYLSGNQLSSLPTEIANLKQLQYLYLEGNNFSVRQKQKIRKLLPNCIIKWSSYE